jgi:phage-related protein
LRERAHRYFARAAHSLTMKKSKKGIATPQSDIDVVTQRLTRAAALNAAQE